MVNLNGNALLFKSFKPLFRDSGKMVCDFARVHVAFRLSIIHNVKFSFFNIQIFNFALLRMMNLNGNVFSLKTTMPFVTVDLEIFHCTHHPVIPKSDLYFTFCSTLNALSKRTSK